MWNTIKKIAARVIKRWKFNNDPVTVLRADQLAVGMVLSPHNYDMGVRVCGEKVNRVDRGEEGGASVVYVRSTVGYGVWTVYLSDPVSVITSSVPADLTSRAS